MGPCCARDLGIMSVWRVVALMDWTPTTKSNALYVDSANGSTLWINWRVAGRGLGAGWCTLDVVIELIGLESVYGKSCHYVARARGGKKGSCRVRTDPIGYIRSSKTKVLPLHQRSHGVLNVPEGQKSMCTTQRAVPEGVLPPFAAMQYPIFGASRRERPLHRPSLPSYTTAY
jgi:hypothetical protein